jgi:hypothetical protein
MPLVDLGERNRVLAALLSRLDADYHILTAQLDTPLVVRDLHHNHSTQP